MRKTLTALLCLLLALPSFPLIAHAEEKPASAFGFFFDTVITLSAYGASEDELNEILEVCAEYEALLSKTVEGSDVWNINHAQGQPVGIDERTAEILRTAREISEASGGVFDITVAPATALWDFSESSEQLLPDEEALAEAAALVDYTRLTLDGQTVTLPDGMQIDLGGIAKGYIADHIAALLREKGVTSALVSLGGNVITVGEKPDGSPWRVGIQDPDGARGASIAAVPAVDLSVVTSGIYERGFTLDGVRYHHILDPATGYPVQNELASVTIIAESSMLCDALSTTCLALGKEKAVELLDHYENAEAVFITRDRELSFTEGLKDNVVLLE